MPMCAELNDCWLVGRADYFGYLEDEHMQEMRESGANVGRMTRIHVLPPLPAPVHKATGTECPVTGAKLAEAILTVLGYDDIDNARAKDLSVFAPHTREATPWQEFFSERKLKKMPAK